MLKKLLPQGDLNKQQIINKKKLSHSAPESFNITAVNEKNKITPSKSAPINFLQDQFKSPSRDSDSHMKFIKPHKSSSFNAQKSKQPLESTKKHSNNDKLHPKNGETISKIQVKVNGKVVKDDTEILKNKSLFDKLKLDAISNMHTSPLLSSSGIMSPEQFEEFDFENDAFFKHPSPKLELKKIRNVEDAVTNATRKSSSAKNSPPTAPQKKIQLTEDQLGIIQQNFLKTLLSQGYEITPKDKAHESLTGELAHHEE